MDSLGIASPDKTRGFKGLPPIRASVRDLRCAHEVERHNATNDATRLRRSDGSIIAHGKGNEVI